MSMLDIHADALATVDENFHNFMLRYRADRKVVYGFVEGKEDPMFYRSVIERFLPEGWTVDLIAAGGKGKVEKVFGSFDWSIYPRTRISFFMDRDLDELIPLMPLDEPNVYYTDMYSIENGMVTKSTLLRMLSEVFNVVDTTTDEEDELSIRYDSNLAFFQHNLRRLMAQITIWRRAKVNALLDRLDMSRLFEFNSGLIRLRSGVVDDDDIVTQAAAVLCLPRVADSVLIPEIANFDSKDGSRRLIRGKYLVWFLSEHLSHIHANVNLYVKSYLRSPKIRVTVGAGNIMIYVAPRSRCPLSLQEFLAENFLKYINTRTQSVGVQDL